MATSNIMQNTIQPDKAITYESLGGSSTHVVVNFHLIDPNDNLVDIPMYLGSTITISYSIYRSKQSVFNFGSNMIDGFAIGNKYVAGTIIKGVFYKDELNKLLAVLKTNLIDGFNPSDIATIADKNIVHSLMKDDLLSCDINIIYTNEYSDDTQIEIIHDATFINNGQVASINDIITETTLSYIAREVTTMESTTNGVSARGSKSSTVTATDLLFG